MSGMADYVWRKFDNHLTVELNKNTRQRGALQSQMSERINEYADLPNRSSKEINTMWQLLIKKEREMTRLQQQQLQQKKKRPW